MSSGSSQKALMRHQATRFRVRNKKGENRVKLVEEGNKDEKEVQKEEVKAYSYAIALANAFATLRHIPPYARDLRVELSLGLT